MNPPYLLLTIRRDYIIEDALVQLQHKSHEDLKKQLKVKFVNEEGIDEGGVQKEFFQLAMRELIDPKYGAFFADQILSLSNLDRIVCWKMATTYNGPHLIFFYFFLCLPL